MNSEIDGLDRIREAYQDRIHLHLVPHGDDQDLRMPSGWRSWIEDCELWFTVWDTDSLEVELTAAFGQEAMEAASKLNAKRRFELWLCLVLYLEGGVSFGIDVDLLQRSKFEELIPKDGGLLLISSGESSIMMAGSESDPKLKTLVRCILSLETEDQPANEECTILDLEELTCLRSVTPQHSESSQSSASYSEDCDATSEQSSDEWSSTDAATDQDEEE